MSSNQKEFSEALFNLLSPLSLEYDQHVNNVSKSQDELLNKIQELRQRIQSCSAEANSFVNIDPYLNRLSICMKNVELMNADMKIIRDRVTKLIHKAKDKYPSVWKSREQSLNEPSSQNESETEAKTDIGIENNTKNENETPNEEITFHNQEKIESNNSIEEIQNIENLEISDETNSKTVQ